MEVLGEVRGKTATEDFRVNGPEQRDCRSGEEVKRCEREGVIVDKRVATSCRAGGC